ncbi:MAG: hypothetical protein J6M60_04420 [Clostridia bacterium]|nr:hypothetical protein [Clostridia bacterium]
MNMDDLEMLSSIIWKRMQQRLNRRVDELEQERYRFFIWLMMNMEEAIEREYPPTGRIVKYFRVEKNGQRAVEVFTNFTLNNTFTSRPTIEVDEFIKMAAEVVNFIETLDGYEILNRFPKESRTEITDFQIIVDYTSRKEK